MSTLGRRCQARRPPGIRHQSLRIASPGDAPCLPTIEMPDRGRASRPLAIFLLLTAVHRSASLRPNHANRSPARGWRRLQFRQLLVIQAIPSAALSIAAGTNESGTITSAIRIKTSSVAATFGRFPKLRRSIRVSEQARWPPTRPPSTQEAVTQSKQAKMVAPIPGAQRPLCPKAQ